MSEHNKILKENQLLLKKIIDIHKRFNQHSDHTSFLQSLNVIVTKKRFEEINKENLVI